MNAATLGQFINETFMPFVPQAAGMVIGIVIVIAIIVLISFEFLRRVDSL